MADKKSIFDKYKSIDENGEIKQEPLEETQSAQEIVPETIVEPEKEVETEAVETTVLDEATLSAYNFKGNENDEIDEILKSISLSENIDDVSTEIVTEPEVTVAVNESVEDEVATSDVDATEASDNEISVIAENSEVVAKEKKKKQPKEKKEKKEKKPKQPKEEVERAEPEPATKKDYFTIVIALVAVALAIAFVVVKYFPSRQGGNSEETTTVVSEQELASVQVFREGYLTNLVQSDIPDVFYQFSSDYSIQYYQYRDNRMVPVQTTGVIPANVDYGPTKISVNIEYVQLGDEVFGVGIFRPSEHPGVPLYNIQSIIFKMTNMPAGYGSEGKALLLAKIVRGVSIEGEFDEWAESYSLDMNTGKTSRFLKIINRNTDPTTGTYVEDFCVLTESGYKSTSGKIPFFTARDYDVGVESEDIYVKNGSGESVLIRNASRRLVIVEGDAVIFMRRNETGFNILRKENGTEKLVFKFTGEMNKCMFDGDYILDKEKATLYNMRTGEEKLIVGYKMTLPEEMKVSPDGRYLIVMGTMKNIMDYQVHIFDLENGGYAKYIEKNYSTVKGHTKNVSFIDNHTVMYMLIDPNRGRECVVLDLAKAFE